MRHVVVFVVDGVDFEGCAEVNEAVDVIDWEEEAAHEWVLPFWL